MAIKKFKMYPFYNTLSYLIDENRCSMFGVDTLSELNSYIEGFSSALHAHQIIDKQMEHFYFGFSKFLTENNYIGSGLGWCSGIKIITENEEERFKLFKKWLEEYKKEVPIEL